ncbi:MAG TPA: PilN domain-containing protein [Candidatus Kryptonia bacterium]|nr:PilN domain-containing protein [Candidatus Kryptonia bacterium]
MIRINLLPLKETQRAVGQRQQLSVALLSLSVALLIMVVPFVVQGRKLSHLDDRVATLQQEIIQLNEQTREARDLDKKKKELGAKLKVIDDLNQKRVGPLHVLESLSTAAPEKLWLVEFAEVKGQATITGLALDNQTIATFLRQLAQSQYFVKVDLDETAQQTQPNRPATEAIAGGFRRFIIRAGIDYFGQGGKAPAPSDGAVAAEAPKKAAAGAPKK